MHSANAPFFSARPRFRALLADAPDLYRVETSRDGLPVAVRACDGRWLSSRYAPGKESARWIDGQGLRREDLPVILGFAPSLLAAFTTRPAVVVERDASRVKALLEADLSAHLEGVTLLVDSDGYDLLSAVRNAFDPFRHNRVKPLPMPFVEEEGAESVAWIQRIAESCLKIQREVSLNALSYAAQLPRWTSTANRNLAAWMDSPDGLCLNRATPGATAVVVGAGPSLDGNVHDLAAARGRALVIAVDTALRRLDRAGIAPDVCVAVDANEANARDVEGLSEEAMSGILVADMIAAPEIVAAWRGPKVFLRCINYTLDLEGAAVPMLQPLDVVLSQIAGRTTMPSWQSGGSVSTNAFALAHMLGARRVIFVGQDLAFTRRRAHASGVAHEEEGLGGMQRFMTREGRDRREIAGDRVLVPAWDGGRVATSTVMREYLNWFETTMKHGFGTEMEVLDATEGGARKEGMKPMRLRDALALCAGDEDPVPRLGSRIAGAGRAGSEGWRGRRTELGRAARSLFERGDTDEIARSLPLARWLALPAYMGGIELPPGEREAVIRAALLAGAEFLGKVWA